MITVISVKSFLLLTTSCVILRVWQCRAFLVHFSSLEGHLIVWLYYRLPCDTYFLSRSLAVRRSCYSFWIIIQQTDSDCHNSIHRLLRRWWRLFSLCHTHSWVAISLSFLVVNQLRIKLNREKLNSVAQTVAAKVETRLTYYILF